MPESQGKIGFGGEIFDGLRFAVFQNLEIVFGQVGDQPPFLVLDVEKELDHVHIDLQRAHRLVAVFTLTLLALVCPGPECPARSRKRLGGRRTAGKRLANSVVAAKIATANL